MKTITAMALVLLAGFVAGGCGAKDDGIGPTTGRERCDEETSCIEDFRCVAGWCIEATAADPDAIVWQAGVSEHLWLWKEAFKYCAELALDGHDDWRLPTISELRLLVRACPYTEPGGECPIANEDRLKYGYANNYCEGCAHREGRGIWGCYWPEELDYRCGRFWSSTPLEDGNGSDYGWWLDFFDASISSNLVSHSQAHARCVRDVD